MSKKLNQAENAPNIQYVGKRQKFDKEKLKAVTVAKQVPAFIMDGREKINLPEGIEKGVFMPTEMVARLFAPRPDYFKTPVLKSAKPVQQKTVKSAAKPKTAKTVKPKEEKKVEVQK